MFYVSSTARLQHLIIFIQVIYNTVIKNLYNFKQKDIYKFDSIIL